MTTDDFPKNPKDFFTYAKKHQAEMVDLKFVDMLGSWQHCSFPMDILERGHVQGRPRVRRLLDSRLDGHPRVGHAGGARCRPPAASIRSLRSRR